MPSPHISFREQVVETLLATAIVAFFAGMGYVTARTIYHVVGCLLGF